MPLRRDRIQSKKLTTALSNVLLLHRVTTAGRSCLYQSRTSPRILLLGLTVAIDVAGSTAGEVAVVSLILEAVTGVMVVVVFLGIGEALSHYLPIDHLPRQKAVLLLLEQSGEYSRQSQLNYDPRHPHCPVPDGKAGCCFTRQ